jgi:hypothetical protein
MQRFIDYLIGLFSQFSPTNQVLLVVFVGGLLFFGFHFVKNESFRQSILRLSVMSFRGFFGNNIMLLNHDLFYKQSFYQQLISKVKFDDGLKTQLFSILLTEKSKTVIEMSKKWVSELKLNEMTDAEMFDRMLALVLEIKLTYERRIRESYQSEGVLGKKNGKAAFDLVYTLFDNFHSGNIEQIQKNIERIAFSNAYSKKQKIYQYLMQLDIATEIAILDCEEVFRGLNGRFTQFKNTMC